METRPLFVEGVWITGDETFPVFDPGTGECIAQVTKVGAEVAHQAVESAHRARRMWRETTGRSRGAILAAAASILEGRMDEVARTLTRENGKPLGQSVAEVNGAVDHLRWFSEEARRSYGRIVPNQVADKRHLILKEPVGVVGAIAPWNFPLMLAARKVAPALAAGCPVVLKPATATPLTALLLAECLEAAGVPAGVFHVVAGDTAGIGAEFMRNPHCRKVSFTGSTAVGKQLIRDSAETVTKLSLELGGHAPVLIFADADIDGAVAGALTTKFRNNGQSCIAANRIYVEHSIYDAFLERFTARVAQMKVGYGLDPGVEIGSLIDQAALTTALDHIEDAKRSGGRIVTGGHQIAGDTGYFLAPTVIDRPGATSLCMREETFAPVAPVVSFTSEEEVIAVANDTPYGLAAYAYTSNLNRAFRLMEQIEAGTVGINDAVPSTSNCPFGGMKESGVGRELGFEGMDAFMEVKHISLGGMAP